MLLGVAVQIGAGGLPCAQGPPYKQSELHTILGYILKSYSIHKKPKIVNMFY